MGPSPTVKSALLSLTDYYTVLILKQNFNKKSKLKKHQTENCSSLNQSQGSFKVGCLNILLKEKLPTELWQDNKKTF